MRPVTEREFNGHVDAAGKVTWDFPQQVAAYRRHLFTKTGDGAITASFNPLRSKRSDRQNRALHAMLTGWARERGWTVDALKAAVLGIAFGHLEQVAPITGEVVKVLAEPKTSHLDVTKFCHLIETVLETAAEDDYWLDAPDEYRRAKDAAQKKAAKAA